jgi:NAD(P)-dependent dehydrogenase (short-subunit alcohol dehydrogenase family)
VYHLKVLLKDVVILLGASSVIGNQIAVAIADHYSYTLIRVSKTQGLGIASESCNADFSDESGVRNLLNFESFEKLDKFLSRNVGTIKGLVISTGYMARPMEQLSYSELLKAFDANVAYPISRLNLMSSLLTDQSFLVFVSSSLCGIPLQQKHFAYQLAKEHADKLHFAYLKESKPRYRTILVRPGHVSTKLNSYIPTFVRSVDLNDISNKVVDVLESRKLKMGAIKILYVPKYLQFLAFFVKLLPRPFFHLIVSYTSKVKSE